MQKPEGNILAEVIVWLHQMANTSLVQAKEGQVRSLKMALDQAGLDAKAIDYVNAHATSTPAGDIAEALSHNGSFGHKGVPVSSTKIYDWS